MAGAWLAVLAIVAGLFVVLPSASASRLDSDRLDALRASVATAQQDLASAREGLTVLRDQAAALQLEYEGLLADSEGNSTRLAKLRAKIDGQKAARTAAQTAVDEAKAAAARAAEAAYSDPTSIPPPVPPSPSFCIIDDYGQVHCP